MKKFLVATDLSARSDRAVLRALKLAKEFKAHLKIVHVIDQDLPKSLLDETKKIATKEINLCLKGKTKDVKFDIEVIEGSPHLDILKIASKEHVDLIILGLHRHVESGEPINGKVIERIVKNSNKPVLIVKDRAEKEYKNILIGVDFNIHSKKSLKFSLDLFKHSNFNLVHSYHMPFLGAMGNKYDDIEAQFKKTTEDDLKDMIAEVTKGKAAKSSLKIKTKVAKGSVFDVLHLEILKTKPELLVLGTHARSGLSKIVSLNVTDSFLINPPCDVLVTN